MSFDKKEYQKQYNLDNKEKRIQQMKQHYLDNKEKRIQQMKQYRLDNKEKFKQYNLDNKEKIKQYYLDNKEKRKQQVKQHYLDNKEKRKQQAKQWRLENKEKIKQYKLNNREKINKQIIYKRNTNSLFKLSHNLRVRILIAIKSKGWTKNNKTADILGCDFKTVKKHLENKFIDGMCWDNHGLYGWHIDHIKPLAKAETQEELYKLCHYTNLQPLWAADNLSKGANEL